MGKVGVVVEGDVEVEDDAVLTADFLPLQGVGFTSNTDTDTNSVFLGAVERGGEEGEGEEGEKGEEEEGLEKECEEESLSLLARQKSCPEVYFSTRPDRLINRRRMCVIWVK